MPDKKADWFARTTSLIALTLTLIGLYLTHRTYNWQTRESLEEKILLRTGFKYVVEKRAGDLSVDVLNIGLHPINIESIQIEVPCSTVNPPPDATLFPKPRDCPDCEVVKVEVDSRIQTRPYPRSQSGEAVGVW